MWAHCASSLCINLHGLSGWNWVAVRWPLVFFSDEGVRATGSPAACSHRGGAAAHSQLIKGIKGSWHEPIECWHGPIADCAYPSRLLSFLFTNLKFAEAQDTRFSLELFV
jgi:hypothetical protein